MSWAASEVKTNPRPQSPVCFLPGIRVAHILMKWESLTAHDSNACRAARKGRTQAAARPQKSKSSEESNESHSVVWRDLPEDAEKELLKLLQV